MSHACSATSTYKEGGASRIGVSKGVNPRPEIVQGRGCRRVARVQRDYYVQRGRGLQDWRVQMGEPEA